jgi:hypothetical protein
MRGLHIHREGQQAKAHQDTPAMAIDGKYFPIQRVE